MHINVIIYLQVSFLSYLKRTAMDPFVLTSYLDTITLVNLYIMTYIERIRFKFSRTTKPKALVCSHCCK